MYYCGMFDSLFTTITVCLLHYWGMSMIIHSRREGGLVKPHQTHVFSRHVCHLANRITQGRQGLKPRGGLGMVGLVRVGAGRAICVLVELLWKLLNAPWLFGRRGQTAGQRWPVGIA